MSRSTFQGKAGLIFALVAFVLGLTAATALGWENENENQGKGHGKKETPPTVTTPTTPTAPVTPAPAPTPTPPAAAPAPAPAPPEQVTVKRPPKPKAKRKQKRAAPVQVTRPTLAPAVERKQLARTGLDPAVMVLLGFFCLAGGGLLFRRAMGR
jgi:outer membrane biosynthesis protein TonB